MDASIKQAEDSAAKRSVILMAKIFVLTWLISFVLMATVHTHAVKFRWGMSKSVATVLLEKYDEAKKQALYVSIILSFLLSQSAIWRTALVETSRGRGRKQIRTGCCSGMASCSVARKNTVSLTKAIQVDVAGFLERGCVMKLCPQRS